MRTTGCLGLLSLVLQEPSSVDSKLDDGLDEDSRSYAVFVRMRDQLLGHRGDYERFCREHQKEKRSEVRKLVLSRLREKSESSFAEIQETVRALQKNKEIRDLTRFWIVNGFACEATGKACRELAEHQSVEFVYLQRGPRRVRQHRPARRSGRVRRAAQRKTLKRVLAAWKDDTDQELDVSRLQIPWNLERVQADRVWREEKVLGEGVVVALCDSGLLVTPALTRALWRNPGEKLNGKDDDQNGYVDDVFGYDFGSDSPYCIGDGMLPHGSICAGIVAGRPAGPKRTVTGIAPRARLMILRGMGYLKAYEYALAEGADVLSMSYMWVNMKLGHYRGVFRAAHEHLAAGGIVAVGGAGNFARRAARGKQICIPKDIPCVIAAAGIFEDGRKAPASSEGPCTWDDVKFYGDYPESEPLEKPDVTGCFGGYPTWCRTKVRGRRRWKVVWKGKNDIGLVTGPMGNSFSGPHAGGVAALVYSRNPELNAWEVKEILEDTCKDIGAPGRDRVFGAGLLQALAAVKAAGKIEK